MRQRFVHLTIALRFFSSFSVLFVRNFFHPVHHLAVLCFLDRDCCCAVRNRRVACGFSVASAPSFKLGHYPARERHLVFWGGFPPDF